MEICRLCGNKDPTIDYYDVNAFTITDGNQKVFLYYAIHYTLGIKVKKLDVVKKICEFCKQKVVDFYNYKQAAMNFQNDPSCAQKFENYYYDQVKNKILKTFLNFIEEYNLLALKVEENDNSLLITSTQPKTKVVRATKQKNMKSPEKLKIKEESVDSDLLVNQEPEIEIKQEPPAMEDDPILPEYLSLEIKVENEEWTDDMLVDPDGFHENWMAKYLNKPGKSRRKQVLKEREEATVEVVEVLEEKEEESEEEKEEEEKAGTKEGTKGGTKDGGGEKTLKDPKNPGKKMEIEYLDDPENEEESESSEDSESDESWNEDLAQDEESDGVDPDFPHEFLENSEKLDGLGKTFLGKIKRFKTPQKKRPFAPKQCKFCGKRYSAKEMEPHTEMHNAMVRMVEQDDKFPLFQCPLCQVFFVSEQDLNRHLSNSEQEHEPGSVNQCIYCKKKIKKTKTDNLKHHLLLFHLDTYECPVQVCKMTMPDYSLLYRHLQTSHEGYIDYNITYKCKGCGEIFSKMTQLTLHYRKCSNKEFECDHCDRKFSTISTLKAHKKAIASPLICDVCGRTFFGTILLRAHRKTHFKDEYPEAHKCKICGHQCISSVALSHHIELYHDNSHTYSCQHCDYTTTTKNRLRKHNGKHSGKVICYMCEGEKIFASKNSLSTHLKLIHKVKRIDMSKAVKVPE